MSRLPAEIEADPDTLTDLMNEWAPPQLPANRSAPQAESHANPRSIRPAADMSCRVSAPIALVTAGR